MTRMLFVTVSLACASGFFAAAKYVVEASFREPTYSRVKLSDQDHPVVPTRHRVAK